MQRLRDMVKDDHIAVVAKVEIGNTTVVARRGLKRKLLRLEVPHAVKGCEAHKSAGECSRQPEWRERSCGCRTKRKREFAQNREWVAGFDGASCVTTVIDDRGGKPTRSDLKRRPRRQD